MKKFIIERNLPGAGNLFPDELQALPQTFREIIYQLDKLYHWIQSFVTDDKIYCIHIESQDVVREHSRLSIFPINTISEVIAVIDPLTSNHHPGKRR